MPLSAVRLVTSAGSALVCLKALPPRVCTLSFVFTLCPVFCLCIVCLGFVFVCLRPGLCIDELSVCSAGPRLNHPSRDLWWCMLHVLLIFFITPVFWLWKGQVQMQFRAWRLFGVYASVIGITWTMLFCWNIQFGNILRNGCIGNSYLWKKTTSCPFFLFFLERCWHFRGAWHQNILQ